MEEIDLQSLLIDYCHQKCYSQHFIDDIYFLNGYSVQ